MDVKIGEIVYILIFLHIPPHICDFLIVSANRIEMCGWEDKSYHT